MIKPVPTYKDTKIVVRRLKEYSGRFIDMNRTIFAQGKPSRSKVTDMLCRLFSDRNNIIIDADFDLCEVTLQDYAKYC